MKKFSVAFMACLLKDPQIMGLIWFRDQNPLITGLTEEELSLLKEELTRLSELGHIRPSTSPFGAPVFFICESTGKIRMVTDYHALNKMMIKNGTALPNILELLDRLRTAKIFMKIDLQSGYHLIRMKEQ